MQNHHISCWRGVSVISPQPTNVALFQYNVGKDSFSKQYWYKKEYDKFYKGTCTILYTHFFAGHYEYIKYDSMSIPVQVSNGKESNFYEATGLNKWEGLVQFDNKHNIIVVECTD